MSTKAAQTKVAATLAFAVAMFFVAGLILQLVVGITHGAAVSALTATDIIPRAYADTTFPFPPPNISGGADGGGG